MTTLQEAWAWYAATSRQLHRMKRLAEKYWNALPWEGPLGKDDRFRLLDEVLVREEADRGLLDLDDLAVVVLFSVFEALVRQRVLDEPAEEEPSLRHRALRLAAAETRQRIAEGSFFHVLEPFKDEHADLVEEVNQVRRYRNWVAHGRRGEQPLLLDARKAFDRLSRFLEVLGAPA
jgi:hypothetical protein